MTQCRERGLRIESATWGGDHKMPPAGDACYDAMARFLFPVAGQGPPSQGTDEAGLHGSSADEEDDLAALGF